MLCSSSETCSFTSLIEQSLNWLVRTSAYTSFFVSVVLFVLLSQIMTATPLILISSKEQRPLVSVDMVSLEETAVQNFRTVGRILSTQSGTVSSEIGGIISHIEIEVGDRVSLRQLIVRLDTNTLAWRRQNAVATLVEKQARVTEASAVQHSAEIELRRMEHLRQSAVFSNAKYEDKIEEVERLRAARKAASAAVDQALTNLHLADSELAKAEIRAPYSGVILRRYIEIGSYVAAGAAIVDLMNDYNLEIETDVTAEYVESIKPGTMATVQIGSNPFVKAVVRAVIPDEDPRTRTRLARLTFSVPPQDSGSPLAANQKVTVFFSIRAKLENLVLTVSKDAIVHRGQQDIVFVIEDGIAKLKQVQLGKSIGERFIVVNGLQSGEKTVVRGNENLQSGQAVQLVLGGNSTKSGSDVEQR